MDIAKLITIVQEYEELYNLKHPHYSNQQRRDNIWEEIGKRLDQNGQACKEKWSRTRDNHRKALNLRKTKSGQAASKLKPPKYYKELSFLTSYLTDEEERLSNISPPICDNSNGDEEEHSDTTNESSCTQESQPTSSVLLSRNVGRKSKIVTPPKASAVDVLQGYLTKKEQLNSDPMVEFFINMAKTVKMFPIQDQVNIKAQLFQMVNNVEMRLALTSSTSVSDVTMPPPPLNYSRFSTPSTLNRAMNGLPSMNETLHNHCPSPVTMSPSPNSKVIMSPLPDSNAIISTLTSTNQFSYTQDQDNQYLSKFFKFPYNNINNNVSR